jgi:hypothetical protein
MTITPSPFSIRASLTICSKANLLVDTETSSMDPRHQRDLAKPNVTIFETEMGF